MKINKYKIIYPVAFSLIAFVLVALIAYYPNATHERDIDYANKSVQLVNNYINGNIGYTEALTNINYYADVTNDEQIKNAISKIFFALNDSQGYKSKDINKNLSTSKDNLLDLIYP